MRPSSAVVRRVLLVTSCALLVAGVVRAGAQTYRERLAAFEKEAAAARSKLNLGGRDAAAKLHAAYPTPEVALKGLGSGEGESTVTCPGRQATVRIPGKFAKGTAFIVLSDDVTVVKETLSPTAWEAVVKVAPNLPPTNVEVRVASPVSGNHALVTGLKIRCETTWNLKLDSGQSLKLRAAFDGHTTSAEGAGAWTPGGPVTMLVEGQGGKHSMTRMAGLEEQQATAERFGAAMSSPASQALDRRLEASMAKLTACQEKAPEQMVKCMEPVTQEMDRINVDREKLMAQAQSPKVVCEELSLTVRGGRVTGQAESCADGKTHAVTGSFTAP